MRFSKLGQSVRAVENIETAACYVAQAPGADHAIVQIGVVQVADELCGLASRQVLFGIAPEHAEKSVGFFVARLLEGGEHGLRRGAIAGRGLAELLDDLRPGLPPRAAAQ